MRPKAEALGYLEARARANTGISPLRRKSAPSVEMTLVWWGVGEQQQEQGQQQQPIQWSIRYAQDDEGKGGANVCKNTLSAKNASD